MESTAAAESERRRASGAHVLKFLAVAALILYHYMYRYAAPGERSTSLIQSVSGLGFLGIDVFLMVSGFMIMGSARIHNATGFVRERILRRFPEFWIAVIVSGLVFQFAPIHEGRIPSPGTVLANLSMVPQVLGFPTVDALYELLIEELRFSFIVWSVILVGQFKRIDFVLFAIIVVSVVGTVSTIPIALRALIVFPVGPLFAIGGLLALVQASGWTVARAIGLALAVLAASLVALREMTSYVGPEHLTTATSIIAVVLLVSSCIFLAVLGSRDLGASLGRRSLILCTLAYPLLLLESTGKAIFLKGSISAPQPALLFFALVFSTTVAYAVMRLGTGPLHANLRLRVDALIARVPALRG